MQYKKTFKQFLYESEKMQKLAKLLNVSGKDIDQFSEKEIVSILANIGKHDFVPDSNFNQKELKLGVDEELEHTDSVIVAKLITKDHLTDDPKYYSKLKKFDTRSLKK